MKALNWSSFLKPALAATLLSTAGWAFAFPDKPITLVVPFPAGTATDVLARALADPASKALGQPVLIENEPGGQGAIAAANVAAATPDGHRLLMASSGPMAGLPAMRKNLRYDPRKDFAPITDVGRFSIYLWASPKFPPNTVQEVVAYAKAHPGQVSYASGNMSGIASATQLAALAGVEMKHVPYKGESAAVTDLVAGRVQILFASPTNAAPLEQSGQLKVLAYALDKRNPQYPKVPTMAESGVQGFSIASWVALFAPAGTPADIVAKLNAVFVDAMKRPEVVAAMEKQQITLTPSSPEALKTFLSQQIDVYADILRKAGITPE